MIDSVRYLKPVTGNTFQLMTKPVIAMCRTMAQKASTIGKYATENGNAAALGDSRPRMTSEKAPGDYSRSATGSVQESSGGCGQT